MIKYLGRLVIRHCIIVISLIFTILFAFQVVAQSDVVKAIEKYLSENFGVPGYETSWYYNIKGVKIQGSTVIGETDLSPFGMKASNICSAVSGFVFSRENRELSLQNVEVRDSEGRVLIKRRGLGGRCL